MDVQLSESGGMPTDLLVLDDLLQKLASLDARASRVVELRYFGGLTVEETARALGVASRTVRNDWSMARSWLARSLHQGQDEA